MIIARSGGRVFCCGEVIINDSIYGVLGEYLAAYPGVAARPDHYLFFNTRMIDYTRLISRERAWRFVTGIRAAVGLRGISVRICFGKPEAITPGRMMCLAPAIKG